jgi:hypothetical protein
MTRPIPIQTQARALSTFGIGTRPRAELAGSTAGLEGRPLDLWECSAREGAGTTKRG